MYGSSFMVTHMLTSWHYGGVTAGRNERLQPTHHLAGISQLLLQLIA